MQFHSQAKQNSPQFAAIMSSMASSPISDPSTSTFRYVMLQWPNSSFIMVGICAWERPMDPWFDFASSSNPYLVNGRAQFVLQHRTNPIRGTHDSHPPAIASYIQWLIFWGKPIRRWGQKSHALLYNPYISCMAGSKETSSFLPQRNTRVGSSGGIFLNPTINPDFQGFETWTPWFLKVTTKPNGHPWNIYSRARWVLNAGQSGLSSCLSLPSSSFWTTGRPFHP